MSLLACDGPTRVRPPGERLGEGEVVLEGVRFDRFDGDRLAERVEAARMRLSREDQRIWAEDVDAVRFDARNGEPRSRVRAPRGRMDAKRRMSVLTGGVLVEDGSGRVIETESVVHDAAQDQLQGDELVRVRGPDFTLEGKGFMLYSAEDRLEIGGPVQAVVEPRPSSP